MSARIIRFETEGVVEEHIMDQLVGKGAIIVDAQKNVFKRQNQTMLRKATMKQELESIANQTMLNIILRVLKAKGAVFVW